MNFQAAITVQDAPLSIDCAWWGGPGAPLWVVLHEGLGSVAMWKDFPQQLAQALNARVLAYSRPGYGRSTPRAATEQWGTDFMHVQAQQVLPALLDALGIHEPVSLLGHSDGASIALLFAAAQPARCSRVVALAPHLFVEDLTLSSISQTLPAYVCGPLKSGLAKYHADPDSAFHGWYGAWMNPAFQAWNIEADVARVQCPVLAIQGLDDEYGTMAQIERIAALLPQAQLLKLPNCGHSPHRDQTAAVLEACGAFAQAEPLLNPNP